MSFFPIVRGKSLGGPIAPSSTRWGVFLREPGSTSSGRIAVSEVKARDIGGVSLMAGTVVSTPNSLSSGSIGNVVDGDPATFIENIIARALEWNTKPVDIDVTLPSAVVVDQAWLYARGDILGRDVTAFSILRSDDGGTIYNNLADYTTADGWRRGERRDFAVPGAVASDKWRLRVTAGDGNWDISELELFSGGVLVSRGAAATASPGPSAGVISRLTDGDGELGIVIDFPAPVAPADIQVTIRDGIDRFAGVVEIRLWDGSKWITTDTYAGLTWVQGETKTFPITPP